MWVSVGTTQTYQERTLTQQRGEIIMKVKATTFRDYWNTTSFRWTYPKGAQGAHLTIEEKDRKSNPDILADYEFYGFHYTADGTSAAVLFGESRGGGEW